MMVTFLKHSWKMVLAATLSLFLVITFYPLTSLPLHAAATAFSDLPSASPYYPYASFLAGKGLFTGYPDGSFRPAGPITRAEIAFLVAKAGGLSGYKPVRPTFKDVRPSHWAYEMIEAASRAGLIKGYTDGTFRPEARVSRAETASLVLRLTKEPLPSVDLPASVKDVRPGFWAKNQVAAAIDAGMMGLTTQETFAPDQPATRAQAARALAVLLNLAPEHMRVPLSGTLVPLKGEVMLTQPGKEPQKVTAETTCTKGAVIKTGSSAEANLKFPDGSSILLKPNTELAINDVRGQAVIKKDGSPGATIDWLAVKLTRGKIFGALATSYFFQHQETQAKVGNTTSGILRAFKRGLPGNNPPWWKQASAKRVRVKVDMPWGVAGIRGTFWSNEVGAAGQTTSVVDGEAQVTSGGITVNVAQGQQTTITSAQAPPAPPAPMPPAEQQAWQQVRNWVEQTAQAIDNNTPVVEAPAQVEQPAVQEQQQQQATVSDITQQVMDSFNQSTGGTTTSTTSNNSGGGGSSGDSNTVSIQTVNATGTTLIITLSKGVLSSVLDDYVPKVTLTDGNTYKIGVWDSNGNPSICLEGIQSSGTTVTIMAVGAQSGINYTAKLYTGTLYEPDFSTVASSNPFVFTQIPSMTINPCGLTEGYSGMILSVSGTNTHFTSGITTLTITDNYEDNVTGSSTLTITSQTSASIALADGLSSGSYYVKLFTNTEVVTGSFSISPLPGYIEINPTGLPVGYDTVTLSVYGVDTDFDQTTTLAIYKDGQYCTGSSTLEVTSPTSASVTLASGLAPGHYDLEFTTSTKTIGRSFDITPQGGCIVLNPSGLTEGYSSVVAWVYGINTNFEEGPTTLQIFDSNHYDVTGNSLLTVTSPTSASIALRDGLPAGSYNVELTTHLAYGGDRTFGTDLVVSSPVGNLAINPNGLPEGYSSVTLSVYGTGTHFDNTTTLAILDANNVDVTGTSSLAVASPTMASISLTDDLAAGDYTIRLTTPTVTEVVYASLWVASPPGYIELNPTGLKAGYENVAISVYGTNTNFMGGTTILTIHDSSHADVTGASTLEVVDSTTAIVNLDSGLASGVYDIELKTNGESVGRTFTIAAPSGCIALNPNGLTAGYSTLSIAVTGMNTAFTTETTTLKILDSNNQNVTGSSTVTVIGPSTATIDLAPGLEPGTYKIVLTTQMPGGVQQELSNVLSVY
ncbi:MAG: hypothetical protein GXX09_08400 [Syntrophomonadaceae bacterium]|nr:hypothetical protein [Syntrophomonadaceae bacterium]